MWQTELEGVPSPLSDDRDRADGRSDRPVQPLSQGLSAQRFSLAVKPTPKGRVRFSNGHAWTPAKTRYAEEAIADMLRSDGAVLFPRDTALQVRVTCIVERPKSLPKSAIYPTKRPDLDQYVKLVLDAGNGVLWVDDAQITTVISSKFYGDPPGIIIEVLTEEFRWRGSHGHDVVGTPIAG